MDPMIRQPVNHARALIGFRWLLVSLVLGTAVIVDTGPLPSLGIVAAGIGLSSFLRSGFPLLPQRLLGAATGAMILSFVVGIGASVMDRSGLAASVAQVGLLFVGLSFFCASFMVLARAADEESLSFTWSRACASVGAAFLALVLVVVAAPTLKIREGSADGRLFVDDASIHIGGSVGWVFVLLAASLAFLAFVLIIVASVQTADSLRHAEPRRSA